MKSLADTDRIFSIAKDWAVDNGISKKGDRLIVAAGAPMGVPGTTNLLKVLR